MRLHKAFIFAKARYGVGFHFTYPTKKVLLESIASIVFDRDSL